MTFTIHRENQPPRIIRMGHAPVVIEPPTEPQDIATPLADLASSLGRFNEALEKAINPPPEPVKNQKGVKKMADEKKLGHETGVKKIHEEDPGKQGPVGTGSEKPPAGGSGEDLTLGKQEGEDNG